MYDKEKDSFTLSVRDLASGTLLDKPRADRVANLSWAMNGKALLYTVTNSEKRPHRWVCQKVMIKWIFLLFFFYCNCIFAIFRIFCSMLGSTKDDVLILEESDENAYVNIRNTKDFQFITVNIFSNTSSKVSWNLRTLCSISSIVFLHLESLFQVYLINAAEPLNNMTLVWECEPLSNCIIEHHHKILYLFTNAAKGAVPADSHYLLCSRLEASGYGNWEVINFQMFV